MPHETSRAGFLSFARTQLHTVITTQMKFEEKIDLARLIPTLVKQFRKQQWLERSGKKNNNNRGDGVGDEKKRCNEI